MSKLRMKLLSLRHGKSNEDIDLMLFEAIELFNNTGNRDQVFYF